MMILKTKKLHLLFFIIIFQVANGQTVLLKESFESYQDFTINNFGGWIGLDLDQLDTWTLGGDPAPPDNWYATWLNARSKMAFQVFTPSNANVSNDATGATGEIRNFDPHTGIKYAGSWAGVMVESFQGNKDWLISPPITLGSSGNELTLWLKSLSTSYGEERYRIGVFLGNGIPASSDDFTIISANYSPTEQYQFAPAIWTKDTYSLNTYSNKVVRIGVYCMTQEGSMLMVDDVKVTTTGTVPTSIHRQQTSKINAFPNPTKGNVNITADESVTKVEIYNTVGQRVKTAVQPKVDISNLNKGMYTFKVYFSDKVSETINVIKN